jgi:hypothetical protein
MLAYISALPLLQGDEVQPISLKPTQLGSLAFCLQLSSLDDASQLA